MHLSCNSQRLLVKESVSIVEGFVGKESSTESRELELVSLSLFGVDYLRDAEEIGYLEKLQEPATSKCS